MSKLGKVLGPVLVVLTIAAAVLSFLIANNRTLFRQRAADLSKGLSGVATALDAGSNTGTAGKVTFNQGEDKKESGTLAWEEYKKSASNYNTTIGEVRTLAGKVIEQRDAEAQALLNISKNIWFAAPEEAAEDILTIGKYEELVAQLTAHSEAIRDRDVQLFRALDGISRKLSLGGLGDANAFLSKNYDAVSPQIDKIAAAVTEMQTRCAKYAAGYSSLKNAIPRHTWKFNGQLKDTTALANIDTQIAALVKEDAKILNSALVTKAELEQEVAKMRQQIEDMAAAQANLEAKNKLLEQKIKDLSANSMDNISGPILTDVSEIRDDLNGKVMAVDAATGFAVINLNNREVVVGARLAICDGKDFVCTVEVFKTDDNNSIVTVFGNGSIADVKPGFSVILGSQKLQK